MNPDTHPEFVTDCDSTKAFLRRYYKRLDSDIREWGADFLQTKIESYDAEIAKHGFALISAHDSVTGRVVKYSPAPVIASPNDIDEKFADNAFAGTSHSPERRGYLYRNDYANGVNGFYAHMLPLAKTDEQKAILATEMERFKQGYLKHMNAFLASHANVVSWMVAGPSKFPAARMEKRSRWADNKRNELIEWEKKARHAIKEKIMDARTPDAKLNAEWEALRKDFARSLEYMNGIHAEGYNRAAFSNSISGKIERLAKNGEVALVQKAIDWIAEHNKDGHKPAFTPRHKIWTFLDLAKQSADRHTVRAAKENEIIGEANGIQLWANYPEDRAQLIFPGKPDHQTRENLKRSGWKWSPRNEAWQRQLTDNALHAGKAFLTGLTPPPEAEQSGPAL